MVNGPTLRAIVPVFLNNIETLNIYVVILLMNKIKVFCLSLKISPIISFWTSVVQCLE